MACESAGRQKLKTGIPEMILTSHQSEYSKKLPQASVWKFGCNVFDRAKCLVAMDRPGKNELGSYQSLLEKVLALHPVQSLPAARKNRYLDGGSSDARMHFFAICFAGLDRTSFRADCLEPRRVHCV